MTHDLVGALAALEAGLAAKGHANPEAMLSVHGSGGPVSIGLYGSGGLLFAWATATAGIPDAIAAARSWICTAPRPKE